MIPTEDLAVHHDLPGIDGEVCVVEAPIKLLGRLGLVRRVVIRRDVFMRERLCRGDSFPGIKDKHLLEKVKS